MKLLTKAIETKLLKNAELSASGENTDNLKPVLKLFNPCGAATWLITELDESGLMFGLADMGFGTPELGYVSLDELKGIRLPFGLTIERDTSFEADKTLAEYAREARELGRIAA